MKFMVICGNILKQFKVVAVAGILRAENIIFNLKSYAAIIKS